MNTGKLSEAQQRMMTELQTAGSSAPPWGYPSAGRDASAWHRTARSLQALGLLNLLRSPHGYRGREDRAETGARQMITIHIIFHALKATRDTTLAAEREQHASKEPTR